ncbi:MAG: DUF3025 domain-containing protein [Ramlibacter sp.]
MAGWRDQLDELHAGRPWFEPWQDAGCRVEHGLDSGESLHDALNHQRPAGVTFVPPGELPPGVAYEQFIFQQARCPTRDCLHDFFNGLAWLVMPQAKRQLNRVQAAQIAERGVEPQRGLVRDAATLFDENGAVLQAPDALWQALQERDWRRLFVELRPLWAQARLVVFGHALLEKLVHPRKALTAHVWWHRYPGGDLAGVDTWLALQLTADRLADKSFLPLPVLGVPGWWPENGNFSFYDDPQVFRTAGRQESTTTTPSAASRP